MIPLLLAAPLSLAAVYDVHVSGTFSDIYGTPWGLTSAPVPVAMTLTIDTDAAPIDTIADPRWPGPVYAYPAAVVSMAPYTLGTLTLGIGDLADTYMSPSPSSYKMMTDQPLSHGADTQVFLEFHPPGGVIQFMPGVCWITCGFTTTGSADDTTTGGSLYGYHFRATVLARAPSLRLDVPYAIPGEKTLLHATGAVPGDEVYFAAGAAQGAGPCPSSLNGLCLDVLRPTLLGTATATSRGDAWLLVTVPPTHPTERLVHFQAAAASAGSKSPITSVRTTAN